MFTPSRSHTPLGSGSGRRRSAAPFNLTPRRSQLSGSKTSLSRRSHLGLYPRSSPDTSTLGSPSIPSIFTTDNYTFESAGSSLPVLVNEAITLAEKSTEISVEIGESGWAWLVCQRKLFVWRFRQGVSKNALCKEFFLPSFGDNESLHRASLVCTGIVDSSNEALVSLLVVTLDGNIRFWPNIIQNVSSVIEATLDDIGTGSPDEECLKVVSIRSRGFLVGTNKGALFHLQPSQNTINCTRLQVSHGMLAGIGRRVSSFFFSAAQDINVLNFITLNESVRSPPEVVMLTTSSLQKWRLASLGSGQGADHMISQVDLDTLLLDPISQAIWNSPGKQLRIWPLDVVLASKLNHVAMLVAVADTTVISTHGTIIRFVVCVCPPTLLHGGKDTHSNLEISVLDHTEVMQNEEDCDSFSYRLLVPDATASSPERVILWRGSHLMMRLLTKGSTDQEDSIAIDTAGDTLIGVGKYDSRCILLTKDNGLLVINPNVSSQSYVTQNIEDSILHTPSSTPQTPLASLPGTPVISKAKIEQLEVSESGTQRLQAAFIHFNRMNASQAKSIIEEAFGEVEAGGELDEAVIAVSQELIDDYPAQDPRWAESVPQDSGTSSGSLILLHQLQDKQKAHQLYLNFLTEVGIWESLDTIKVKGATSCTRWLLAEHGEKLAAAISLRQKHTHHQGVVDAAIRKVLELRGRIMNKRGLTPQDVFYREVSRVQDILGCLLDTEEEMIGNSMLSSREMFAAVAGVNEIFEGMLSSAHQYRKSKGIPMSDTRSSRFKVEFSPWTVATGRHSVREVVMRQHDITIERGLAEAEDGQQVAALHAHMVALTDLLLNGYLQQLDSLTDCQSLSARRDEISAAYRRSRTNLISPILDLGLVDKAATLAERYHDFGILVDLCDRKGDQERLSEYMSQFASQGFSNYLFNWYLERGKFRDLLECASSNHLPVSEYNEKLSSFLSSHPKIAWLHQIRSGDYMGAHDTLQYLAAVETQSAQKKANLLSLSKLSAIFSDEREEMVAEKVEAINSQHIFLRYQETLPSSVLEKLGMNVDSMPVFPPHKIIEFYVGEDNTNSNEVDFKKALDLLQFLPQNPEDNDSEEMEEYKTESPDMDAMNLFIWCRVILKDSWDTIHPDPDPIDACKHTMLFKTLQLAHEAGMLEECFPDVDVLLDQHDLESLSKNPSSEFLIRAGFEQARRLIAAS